MIMITAHWWNRQLPTLARFCNIIYVNLMCFQYKMMFFEVFYVKIITLTQMMYSQNDSLIDKTLFFWMSSKHVDKSMITVTVSVLSLFSLHLGLFLYTYWGFQVSTYLRYLTCGLHYFSLYVDLSCLLLMKY